LHPETPEKKNVACWFEVPIEGRSIPLWWIYATKSLYFRVHLGPKNCRECFFPISHFKKYFQSHISIYNSITIFEYNSSSKTVSVTRRPRSNIDFDQISSYKASFLHHILESNSLHIIPFLIKFFSFIFVPNNYNSLETIFASSGVIAAEWNEI